MDALKLRFAAMQDRYQIDQHLMPCDGLCELRRIMYIAAHRLQARKCLNLAGVFNFSCGHGDLMASADELFANVAANEACAA